VFRLLQRLLLPLFVLALLITLLNFKDNFGYESINQLETNDQNTDLLTPVFSLRRAPKLLTSPLANQKLTDDIENLIADLPESSCLSIESPIENIFAHKTEIPLTPGGAQKIITAYAALQQLGKDFQYETIVAADRETDEDGNLLSSDLYVFGSGDPLLRTNSYAELLPDSYSQIRTNADELADLTVGVNILFIQGAVVVNESRYDEERTVPGWSNDLKEAALIGSLSAALLDGGFDGLKQNYAEQKEAENPAPLTPSANPAKRFAANFDDLLEARNVIILQAAKETTGVELVDTVELLSIKSPTMDLIIKQMLTNDDTVTAEMVLKEIGYSRTGQGTTGAGLVSIPEIINGAGLADTGILLIDGSGLSNENQINCNLLNSILEDPDTKDVFLNGLPIASQEGIVSDQFIGTEFETKLRAHYSQSATYASLAGYYTTPNGTQLILSLIVNASPDDEMFREDTAGFVGKFAEALSAYSGGQPLDELGPLGISQP